MASRYLGPQFDFHGGGIDLIFPHHENELAQSEAYWGVSPARCWVHNGLITQGSIKMSKSLGNGISLRELLDRVSPMALRTYLLSVHYRSPLDFSQDALEDWSRGIVRVWDMYERVKDAGSPSERLDQPWAKRLESFEERLLAALDDDFNTARALAEIYEMVRDVHQGEASGHAETAHGWARINILKADQVLGILPWPATPRSLEHDKLLAALLSWRQEARLEKDFKIADRIRVVLSQAGWTIEDTPRGPRVVAKEDV